MIGAVWADLLLLLGGAVLAILFMALLAALEALGWHAGWRPRRTYTSRSGHTCAGDATTAATGPAAATPEAAAYSVFLSGIGNPSGRWHYPGAPPSQAQRVIANARRRDQDNAPGRE